MGSFGHFWILSNPTTQTEPIRPPTSTNYPNSLLGARGEIAAHFLLTGNGMATYQRDVYQYCYGTSVVTYAESDYIEMARMIDLLAERAAVGQPA